jgi:gamma-glutamylcyclotransferase
MTFLYFAYGSNMLPARLLGRCPSAKVVRTGVARAWSLIFEGE